MRNGLALAAGLLAGLWLDTTRRTARVERDHPPRGRFVDADGVRLHYLDRGPANKADDPPVVFLHGNSILAEDWSLSILDQAARQRRCIAFDRPGHGYSEQPPGAYGAAEQAAILRAGARALGLERPIILGHSLGGIVALAWALNHPDEVGGVVFLSGYAYPTPRADFIPFMGPAIPVAGPVMSRTILQPVDRLLLPPLMRRVFEPNPVPPYYADIPPDLLLRPTQLEAAAAQIAALIPSAVELSPRYPDIRCPVAIVAGRDDRIVNPQDHAARLHRDIEGSTLHLLAGTGHMPHHARPEAVLAAIDRVDRAIAAEPRKAVPVG